MDRPEGDLELERLAHKIALFYPVFGIGQPHSLPFDLEVGRPERNIEGDLARDRQADHGVQAEAELVQGALGGGPANSLVIVVGIRGIAGRRRQRVCQRDVVSGVISFEPGTAVLELKLEAESFDREIGQTGVHSPARPSLEIDGLVGRALVGAGQERRRKLVGVGAVQDRLLKADSGAELKPVIFPIRACLGEQRQAGEPTKQENEPEPGRDAFIHC